MKYHQAIALKLLSKPKLFKSCDGGWLSLLSPLEPCRRCWDDVDEADVDDLGEVKDVQDSV